ncbi:hypothetical protein COCCADRAFT_113768, partial [Bipolaris zeicola 26-R-13]
PCPIATRAADNGTTNLSNSKLLSSCTHPCERLLGSSIMKFNFHRSSSFIF